MILGLIADGYTHAAGSWAGVCGALSARRPEEDTAPEGHHLGLPARAPVLSGRFRAAAG